MTVDAQVRGAAPLPDPEGPLFPPGAGGYWAGAWQPVTAPLAVTDPGTGRIVATVSASTAADAEAAISYLDHHWRATPWPLWQRREAIAGAARRLLDHAEGFARTLSMESSKTIREARAEVRRAAETLRLSAEGASCLEGRTVPFDNSQRAAGWVGWYTREPIGLVAAITPFNDPLNLVAHKLGPALMAGNPVVLKPSSETPLSAFALVETLLRAGVPAAYLAVLCGSTASAHLVASELVDVVSFTGGPASADAIVRAGRARKLLMELGGNNALIACADADPGDVADAIVSGAFGVAGQNCLSVQRVLVAEELFDQVLGRVVHGTSQLVVGDKAEERTDVGPLINEAAAMRVHAWVEEAAAAGAQIHVGGSRTGSYLAPTVLTGVPRSARLWREEVFGPVVVLEPFDSLAAAIRAANDSDTGLQAGVFTRDLDTALQIAGQLVTGAVLINSSSDFRVDAMPFGGFKRSGVGREGVASAIEALTEPKIIGIRLGSGAAAPTSALSQG